MALIGVQRIEEIAFKCVYNTYPIDNDSTLKERKEKGRAWCLILIV